MRTYAAEIACASSTACSAICRSTRSTQPALHIFRIVYPWFPFGRRVAVSPSIMQPGKHWFPLVANVWAVHRQRGPRSCSPTSYEAICVRVCCTRYIVPGYHASSPRTSAGRQTRPTRALLEQDETYYCKMECVVHSVDPARIEGQSGTNRRAAHFVPNYREYNQFFATLTYILLLGNSHLVSNRKIKVSTPAPPYQGTTSNGRLLSYSSRTGNLVDSSHRHRPSSDSYTRWDIFTDALSRYHRHLPRRLCALTPWWWLCSRRRHQKDRGAQLG